MNKKPVFRNAILILVAFFALSLVFGTGTVDAQEGVSIPDEAQVQQSQTIYEIIQGESTLSSLEALVEAAALSDNLQQDGPFTVFAPTNDALAAFSAASLEDDVSVTDILLYHVLNGEYMAADLAGEDSIMTLAGEYLYFDTDDSSESGLVLNGTVMVVRADIVASNGVVHIIDTVLPFPNENSDFANDTSSSNTDIEGLIEDGYYEALFSFLERTEEYDAGSQNANTNTSRNILPTIPEEFATQR